MEAFVEAFKLLGYETCDDAGLEVGYEKLAVYANSEGPTHVARQLATGRWTSKLGAWQDIEHATLADLEDSDYGSARIFMRRLRS